MGVACACSEVHIVFERANYDDTESHCRTLNIAILHLSLS